MKSPTTIALLAIAFLFSCHYGAAQGAWNMKYLPLDSVNQSYLWKDVRLDFKRHPREKFHWTGNIREALSKHDTIVLKVGGRPMRFFENWKIYVDHGVLSEQTLQRVTKNKSEDLIIKEMVIRAVDKASITVELYIYGPGDGTKSKTQLITLKKSLINGVIIVR